MFSIFNDKNFSKLELAKFDDNYSGDKCFDDSYSNDKYFYDSYSNDKCFDDSSSDDNRFNNSYFSNNLDYNLDYNLNNITYNLNVENHLDYYQKIEEFTEIVLSKSRMFIEDIILDYKEFLTKNPVENVYIDSFFEEYILELLYFGVLWKLYIKNALNLDPFYQKILAKLSNLRNKKELIGSSYKIQIDEIRGILATKFLFNNNDNGNKNNKNHNKNNDKHNNMNNSNYKDNNTNITDNNKDDNTNNNTNITDNKYNNTNNNGNNNDINEVDISKSIENNEINLINLKIDLLLKYLEATGDYKESLKHLNIWKEFFLNKDENTLKSYFKSIMSFVSFFEDYAKKELHIYTSNVETFKESYLEYHLNNEDIIFCGRSELEYHINLFGAEVMNKIFQKSFKARKKRVLLLPTCMRIPKTHKCNAVKDKLGLRCTSCNNNCNIGEITKNLNGNYNYKDNNHEDNNYEDYNHEDNDCNDEIPVYIVSHSSSILSNLTNDDKTNVSIIGVACINNLIEGGWKISSHGIPPQCVILDYVGCKKHWTPKNIQTTINFNKLQNTV
ncbi:DUF116 domain-containing protein [Methanobrevibacter arboriphilus]|uniref:Uncharacterized protein n=1 Tax=Methanobrevibacter arboriphilus TaxID=39441 RepID=A0ACA8R128_METAZ|nr:DUF116 domain-containing protein [Methanobrevibacter arboriphilus]BBL61195.1 hypothetical protein MarbSA_02350 [Methanobrevibacter arboriphilus]